MESKLSVAWLQSNVADVHLGVAQARFPKASACASTFWKKKLPGATRGQDKAEEVLFLICKLRISRFPSTLLKASSLSAAAHDPRAFLSHIEGSAAALIPH